MEGGDVAELQQKQAEGLELGAIVGGMGESQYRPSAIDESFGSKLNSNDSTIQSKP